MEIRPLDLGDAAEFTAWYAARRAALLHGREGMPSWSEHEARVTLEVPESSAAWDAYVVKDSGRVVGTGVMFRPLTDNLDIAVVEVNVPPELRRRGIGTALLEHLVDECRRLDRPTMLMEADLPYTARDDHPYRSFAERHGFALANVEVRRILELPVSEESLAAWADKAAPHHEAYRLETYGDDLPEELLESYCYLINQLPLDAPTGDIEFEAEAMTPEGLREREHKLKEAGRSVYSTVALNDRGQAVAHSVLCISDEDPVNIQQFATLVHRAHRGHRLGLAVKVRNLREVQRAHPTHQRVITTNAETNDHMVAINVLMGFEPMELLAEFQRKL